MFIDICEIKGKYRGPDRDVNLSLFCLTENYKLDYELYCNFCNYNLEYNGEIEILNSRLDLVNKLNKNSNSVELLIFDNKPIEQLNNLNFLGFDVLNKYLESPLSYNKSTFFLANKKYLNENMLFKKLIDAQNSLTKSSRDEANNLLSIYYIYTYQN